MKKSIFREGSSELWRRIWRTRGSERGMESGSRLRVPDSERFLVRNATRRISSSLDGDDEDENRQLLKHCDVGYRFEHFTVNPKQACLSFLIGAVHRDMDSLISSSFDSSIRRSSMR